MQRFLVAVTVVLGLAFTASAQSSTPYFSGTGGKGMTLAVLEPVGKGLSESEQWMLPLVQGSLTANFNKFSAMTIVDRQNVEKIMADIAEAMESGYYSDETMVKIGQMTNARYVLTGVISKTETAFSFELAVTDAQTGERKASFPPKPVSSMRLENYSAVNEATIDLLKQLGVTLTAAGLDELKKTADMDKVRAEILFEKAIAAEKQGTQVTALGYYYQAAALDPSLADAVKKRSKTIAANITSGNIGADVRNDIAWRKEWVAKLTEFEEFFQKVINDADPPYLFLYSKDIQRGKINYDKETIELSIHTTLLANPKWMKSVEQAATEVYQELNTGLNATGRRNTWGLAKWPKQGVTNASPFTSMVSKRHNISVEFELLNDKNKVIAQQALKLSPSFNLRGENDKIVNSFTRSTPNIVAFKAVNANDISDNLTIRIASVNGAKPEDARFTVSVLQSPKSSEVTSEGKGLLHDTRDGQVYRTAKIGNRLWMAQNLNYEPSKIAPPHRKWWCYDNKTSNCNRYGMLYTWEVAKKACPAGWHLPTKTEWNELVKIAGGKSDGEKLKSKGWGGADELGFSALPGGTRLSNGNFSDVGIYGFWWSDVDKPYYLKIHGKSVRIQEDDTDGRKGNSVRCVQD
jgi:uncharacterized protein (TIGR02145 family)